MNNPDRREEPHKGNILIVDDTPENLQVLSATLTERGYKIRGVINGKMAIRAARSASPDLILLDIRMPDMDGYEVCRSLKADPQTSEIPVIFISALDEVLDKIKAFGAGGADYITKPFQVEEVLARVEHQMTIRKLQKQLIEQNQQLQREIFERRKAEEAAAAASRAKSEFVTNMSHELRTPLNAIIGFTQLMMRDAFLSKNRQEYLRIIYESGKHLLDLINDILDLSKIEAGLIFLCEDSFNLYRLLDGLEELFKVKAENKNLKLNFTTAPDVAPYIKADEKKLRQCLINLLGNAIKFTDRGAVTLRVKNKKWGGEREEEGARTARLEFEVEDTGYGIAAEEIDSIFDAFVQTAAGKKSAEGTGLGLTITRKFVHLMGGEITVSSVLGSGTIFKFYIPIVEVDSSEVLAQPLQRVIGLEGDGEVYRLLVVDDTEENRLLLMKLLQPIGFEVREAENGDRAVAVWESWQPHLIWMDTRMPVMDGLEATRQIRAREKQRVASFENAPSSTPHTVIIALTASAFEERRAEILAAGCDDFVSKPFQEEFIFEKIAERLGVRYIYEDLPETVQSSRQKRYSISEKPDSFFPQLLAEMPLSWVQQLERAANEVDEELVSELIEQIPETSAPLAEALRELINDFRLDRIVELARNRREELEKQS